MQASGHGSYDMNKVIVIGCPGAGNSVFSRELAQRTGLPLIALDFIYHQGVWDKDRKKEQWGERVAELVIRPEWIIDGDYKSTLEMRIRAADTVILISGLFTLMRACQAC